ncbi:hypothetical protein [uncultured Sphingomonas sp.]|uniref:hypothetical protein n=1 Tax=uncultured Sphingomonas sp. TaxID=158754 RepID=UPI0035CB8E41
MTSTVPASGEEFNNASIIALAQAGIGEDVLLAKIASVPCAYDMSTRSIVALKDMGVPNAVIAAMVERCARSSDAQGAGAGTAGPSIKRSSGLYVDLGMAPDHNLIKIRPTTASGGRMTGSSSLLFPFGLRMGISRVAAQMIVTSAQLRFYFYFEPDDARVGNFGSSATASAQSPSEFSLVRFSTKNGQREMVVGKRKAFGANIGINPKDAIQFSIEEIGDGIFSVTPSVLSAGQYGLVLRAGGEAYRVYDFGVSAAGDL